MNTYIMFSFMEEIGGSESYLNSKVAYLQKNKWNVFVFAPRRTVEKNSLWPNLDQFFCNRRNEFRFPPRLLPRKIVVQTITWIKSTIGNVEGNIIIESSSDYLAEWGEILAKDLNAKHFCFLLEERLELYGAKEFLYFKYLRGEVAGIHESSICRLFKDYNGFKETKGPCLKAANYGVVQDIRSQQIDNLVKMDWDIAYIGRNKQYVVNILKGVMKFASSHKEKQIHFIILGDFGKIFTKLPKNVHIENLGFMVPIPQSFFKHVDVVIAGSGCAGLSHLAGALTIVADASTCMASGLLGYTTTDTLFGNGISEDFDVALENALVKKTWKTMPYNRLSDRSKTQVDQCYLEHFKFIEQSDQTKEYFDFQKHPQKYGIITNLRYYMSTYTPALFVLAKKLKRFVETYTNIMSG